MTSRGPNANMNQQESTCSRAWRLASRKVPSALGVGDLKRQGRVVTAFKASSWTMLGYASSQLLRLISMVVLARHLLSPQAFGLVALVNVFLSGLALLSDLGIGTDVIQHRRGDELAFINTAFLIQAGRGTVLGLLALALAYPFSQFYNQPEVFPLAAFAALSVFATGLTSGAVFTLIRHVDLGSLTLLRMSTEAVGLVVSVLWAVVSPTAWALVAGRVASETSFAAGTHVLGKRPVSLQWDATAAKDIIAFGTGMLASSATYFLAGEAERLVVAKFVDLTLLGCFSLALSITAVATGATSRLTSQVFYPMIASIVRNQGDPSRQFRLMRLLILVASICLAVVLILGGKSVVAILLGPRYVAAGWILEILGFRAAIDVFTSITTQMLFALGMSRYAAFGNVTKLAFLGVGLSVAFSHFGIREALWVLAVSSVAAYVPLLFGIRRYLRSVLRVELASFFVLIVSAVTLAAA